MNLNLSKFKKVSADGKKTVLQHPRGHKITIAHSSLSEDMRKDLEALPIHMAKGGRIEDPLPVENSSSVDSLEAPKLDPVLLQKRELYNQFVNQYSHPSESSALGVVNPEVHFGEGGEEPKNFNPQAWNWAENKFKQHQDDLSKIQQEKYERTIQENQARQSAGMAQIPVPEAPITASAAAPMPGDGLATGARGPSAEQPPMDPYGTAQSYNTYMQGMGQANKGLMQEAQAVGQQGQAEAAAAKQYEAEQQQAMKSYQAEHSVLMGAYQKAIHGVETQQINPNHYWDSKSTAGKVSSAIGLILGGMGGGLTHQENPALKFLQSQIDKDIESQKSNLGKQESLLSANLNQMKNMQDAVEMTKAMQYGVYASKLKQAAAVAMDPVAKARAMQEAGKLYMSGAQIVGQMAAKRAMMGPQSQNLDPAVKLRLLGAPESSFKQLKEAQEYVLKRDNAIAAFDRVAKAKTLGYALGNPGKAMSGADAAQLNAAIVEVATDASGRYNENEAHAIQKQFEPSRMDTDADIKMKRNEFIKHIDQKGHFPELQQYGIDVRSHARRDNQGEKKIALGPPVKR